MKNYQGPDLSCQGSELLTDLHALDSKTLYAFHSVVREKGLFHHPLIMIKKGTKGAILSSDHQLMLAVRDGDIEKLGQLFEEHHKRLYNFFLGQTGNCHASEDLVQDVFLRMLKYRHTYRVEGNFMIWMFKIARNACNDYYKKHVPETDQVEEIDQLASNDPSPDRLLEQKSEVLVLQKALNILPQEKKELILMSRFQDLNYKEIGSILGCTVGTVKVRMYRAMKELTEKYFELTG